MTKVVKQGDPLYNPLRKAFARASSGGRLSSHDIPRKITFQGQTWRRVQDANAVKFVSDGPVGQFEESYASQSIPNPEQRSNTFPETKPESESEAKVEEASEDDDDEEPKPKRKRRRRKSKSESTAGEADVRSGEGSTQAGDE